MFLCRVNCFLLEKLTHSCKICHKGKVPFVAFVPLEPGLFSMQPLPVRLLVRAIDSSGCKVKHHVHKIYIQWSWIRARDMLGTPTKKKVA